ncbi:AGE family epimerase/isomerase [Actinomyces sp. B33]|uniref:AGE family epimerase/isomerase n=1 Tax=Actinomyces sp. B33 TaxID=2942131 RepID=UPI0023427055|nr:AGE family epimerase/isomerase [Actinomyces sp. B33]MDC4233009.1 AGE family epimerase/isomerase [Actinomyces sp. B33]
MTKPMSRSEEMLDEARSLLDFARGSRVPHGFGWLNDRGGIDESRGVPLWITGRMTHCFCLGALLGHPGSAALAEHGVSRLLDGPLRSTGDGGWFSAVEADGSVRPGARVSYDHSFVVLAASSGVIAGIPRADELLSEALSSFEALWWDDAEGLVVDARDPDSLEVDPYRGVNANMHWVEALIAAWSATGEIAHVEKARRICERVLGWFLEFDLRLPEHFDETWRPLLEYNRENPADQFRPFGSTPGHWLEWSRLMLEVHDACATAGISCDDRLAGLAPAVYRRALMEGWGVDGLPGFVYTVDFEGRPVVGQRMYWVLAEGICAARTLEVATGDGSYACDVDVFWGWAKEFLIEAPGQWREELDALNRPDDATWSGKPDIYHALQACLIGSVPLCACFAVGIRESSVTLPVG